MLVLRWKWFLIACAVLPGVISDARAEEWLYFYPVTGELSLGFDGRWTDRDSGASDQTTEFEERLRLNLGGYSLDPRVFTFNVNLEPTFEQQKNDWGTQTARTDTTYLNYGARFSALHGVPASPVSLGADFSASTSELDGNLGSRSESTIENRGASLHWKFTPFRSTLSYRERSLDEIFISRSGQPPIERDESEQALTYRGKSRGMELLLEGIEFDDRTILDQDYDSQRARLRNNFHWGRNSSLASRLEYFDREGFNAEETVTVNELLRLQHRRNLFTTYRYGYNSLHRTTDTETHSGNFNLNHLLHSNLTTNFGLSGSTTQADQFQSDTYDASLDFGYSKRFTPDLRVSANLGGGYGTTDSAGGQLDFTESPTVPASGIVFLAQRYIIWSTIVVTAPGCNPCLEGSTADYEVRDAGGDFTELFIPVSTSRINVGINEVITVDYAYQPPAAEFYRVPYRVGVRVDYRSFAFYHRTDGENQTFVSGPDPTAVGDQRTDRTGVEWNWSRGRSRAFLGAERVYTENINWTYTEYSLNQSLNYALAPNAMLNAHASETFLRDGADADTYSGDLSVQWFAVPGLSITPRLSAFHRNADPGVTDDYVRAGVDVRWSWRRLAADLRYDHTDRNTDTTGYVEDRVFFEVRRKF